MGDHGRSEVDELYFTKKKELDEKIKDRWQSIIEKYSAYDLNDQGDVIDLHSGSIVEDNGHLRSLQSRSGLVSNYGLRFSGESEEDTSTSNQQKNPLSITPLKLANGELIPSSNSGNKGPIKQRAIELRRKRSTRSSMTTKQLVERNIILNHILDDPVHSKNKQKDNLNLLASSPSGKLSAIFLNISIKQNLSYISSLGRKRLPAKAPPKDKQAFEGGESSLSTSHVSSSEDHESTSPSKDKSIRRLKSMLGRLTKPNSETDVDEADSSSLKKHVIVVDPTDDDDYLDFGYQLLNVSENVNEAYSGKFENENIQNTENEVDDNVLIENRLLVDSAGSGSSDNAQFYDAEDNLLNNHEVHELSSPSIKIMKLSDSLYNDSGYFEDDEKTFNESQIEDSTVISSCSGSSQKNEIITDNCTRIARDSKNHKTLNDPIDASGRSNEINTTKLINGLRDDELFYDHNNDVPDTSRASLSFEIQDLECEAPGGSSLAIPLIINSESEVSLNCITRNTLEEDTDIIFDETTTNAEKLEKITIPDLQHDFQKSLKSKKTNKKLFESFAKDIDDMFDIDNYNIDTSPTKKIRLI